MHKYLRTSVTNYSEHLMSGKDYTTPHCTLSLSKYRVLHNIYQLALVICSLLRQDKYDKWAKPVRDTIIIILRSLHHINFCPYSFQYSDYSVFYNLFVFFNLFVPFLPFCFVFFNTDLWLDTFHSGFVVIIINSALI